MIDLAFSTKSQKSIFILKRYTKLGSSEDSMALKNGRVFRDHSSSFQLLWDRVVFAASLWANVAGAFRGTFTVTSFPQMLCAISLLQWNFFSDYNNTLCNFNL